MQREISHIPPIPAANVVALVYAVLFSAFALFLGAVMLLLPLAGAPEAGSRWPFLLMLLGYPIFGAATSWVGTALGAVVYNLVAQWIGGIRVEVTDARPA